MKGVLAGFAAAMLTISLAAAQEAAPPKAVAPAAQARFEEIARFKSDMARQGVGVDAEHVYPVTDQGIAKLDKKPASPSPSGKERRTAPSSTSTAPSWSMARFTRVIRTIRRSP